MKSPVIKIACTVEHCAFFGENLLILERVFRNTLYFSYVVVGIVISIKSLKYNDMLQKTEQFILICQ